MNYKIIIGIPVKNTGKYLINLFQQLNQLTYNHLLINVVLVEGDSSDNSYEICKILQNDYTNIFKSVVLKKLDFGFELKHDFSRYNIDTFPERIRNLIITRNFIVSNYLNDNDYLWWVDSDFEIIPSNIIQDFIVCDKDIIIPTLLHDHWGYHDCGSVIFNNNKQHRFQEYSSENLVKLDRADTHCFIKRNVLQNIKYKFVNEIYEDGCGGKQSCWSDGTYFSIEAVKMGFSLYGAKHIKIKHHNV